MSLFSFYKDPIIEFLAPKDLLDVLILPGPANKFVPEWYRELPTHVKGKRDPKGSHAMTAKNVYLCWML